MISWNVRNTGKSSPRRPSRAAAAVGAAPHRAENFSQRTPHFSSAGNVDFQCGMISISLCFLNGLVQGTNPFDFTLGLWKGSRFHQLPARGSEERGAGPGSALLLPSQTGLFLSLFMDGVAFGESHHFMLSGICESGFPTWQFNSAQMCLVHTRATQRPALQHCKGCLTTQV